MSLTQIDVNVLKDSHHPKGLLIESRITFHQHCVINQYAIIDLYNVFWIRTGRARIRIDFDEFEVGENTLFFLLPGQIFTVLSEQNLEGYRLAFESDFYCLSTQHPEIGCSGILFRKFHLDPLLRVDDLTATELEGILDQLKHTMSAESVAQSELVQSYLKIFLITCARLKQQQIAHEHPSEQGGLQWLSDLNTLIEKNFRRWHGVAEYARALNLSPKSLTKKLSRFGRTPSQLIQDRIIMESKRLLYYSNKTTKEVAYELGFEDPSYFSRFFKARTGITPSEFLHQAQASIPA